MDAQQRRLYYLQTMGIEVWERRQAAPVLYSETIPQAEPATTPHSAVINTSADVSTTDALDWDTLEARVLQCTQCGLHISRTQAVFGVGNRQATFMVVGEAPGAEEDRQGEPFVGRAGKLLNEMLRAIGLKREEVYIANVLKCRPPHNRDPLPAEVNACEPYLHRQIDLIMPKVVLAVGRIAAHNLLKTTTNLNGLRGRVHSYRDIPLVITYHPAYLLRTPLDKRKAWDDLKFALRTYKERL